MSDAFPVASAPGRMPVPIFRVTFTLRSRTHKRLYEGERALKAGLAGLRHNYSDEFDWTRITDLRIDLIAAAPIDVTGSYTK